MTIASEIQRIQTNIANAYDAAEAKGATMPVTENSDSLATTIESITGGGEQVEATNRTGASIAANDKVWINPYDYQAGDVTSSLSGGYTHIWSLPNGLYHINIPISSSGSNSYKDNTTNETLGSLTYGAIGYSYNTNVVPVIEPDGVVYSFQNSSSNIGIQRIDNGIGWSHAGWIPVRGSSQWIIDTSDSTFKKINPETGSVIATYEAAVSASWKSTVYCPIYLGNNNFIARLINSSKLEYIQIDLSEETYTVTQTNYSQTLSTVYAITSDYKYLLCEGNILYDLANFPTSMPNVYSTTLFPATITKNSIIMYNSQTDIYTTTGSSGSGSSIHPKPISELTKAIHYDKTNQTFIEIPLDFVNLTSEYSSNHCLVGIVGSYNNLTGIMYGDLNYHRFKQLSANSGNNLITYNPALITATTQTGIAAENIVTGGTGLVNVGAVIEPTGTLSITANGVYDVTNYASANVSVSGGGSSKYGANINTFLGDVDANGVLQQPTEQSDLVFTGVTDVVNLGLFYKFSYSKVKSASFPNLTTISGNSGCASMFYYCSALTSASFPNLTTISGIGGCSSMFYYCSALTSVSFPNLTTISQSSGCAYMLGFCSALTSVSFPNLTTISQSSGCTSMFAYCLNLTDVYFNALTTSSFGSYTNQFNGMMQGTGNTVTHTLHFPSNLQSTIAGLDGYPLFGGTSGYVVCAFDLDPTE